MNQYHQLLGPEDEIIFSAAHAASFQEILEPVLQLIPASIVVADSLHYILALSEDLTHRFSGEISWLDLIRRGYVPPVAEWLSEGMLMPKPNTERLGETLSIHSDLITNSGQYCTMFDILDSGAIMLKLAITAATPLTPPQQKIALALATALRMAYFRLGNSSGTDARGRYLIDLLQEGGAVPNDVSELNNHNFSPKGPFCLICFEIRQLGIQGQSVISMFADLSRQPDLLMAQCGEIFVVLLNTNRDMKQMLGRLDQFSRERSFPILLSRSYLNLHETAQCYREIRSATILATKFRGACGVQHWDEYALFLMFEQLRGSRIAQDCLHRDAEVLLEYDEKKNTQYVLTAYCYLIHNREAPATADALFVHRNTLDKRLRKMEGLIAADWRNVSYQFRMLYSLYLLLERQEQLIFYPQQIC